MNIKLIVAGILLLMLFFVLGVLSYRSQLFPVKQFRNFYHAIKASTVKQIKMDMTRFNNDAYTVIFAFGQSNSANYGQTLYQCKEEVYNWYDGKIYEAGDPLKGAGGFGGSPWTRQGDLMIQNNLDQKVLIVPIGRGGTTVSGWAEGGKQHKLILNAIRQPNSQGIKIDYVLWHQGETDNQYNTSKETYIEKFKTIRSAFRSNHVDAPIFVAVASYIPVEDILLRKNNGCDPNIQNAQKQLAELFPDVFQGANTDSMDKTYYRNDGLHFSDAGLWKHAELWLEVLKSYSK
ncbi:sialate O-acetylesterase [Saccharicrinis sp. FJH2]|uniref:sialate O-acetylesterase n=1 Tax=Saccharicrinis sp. FJH65 TaxID=3344659 RepID=UPI0035F25F5B